MCGILGVYSHLGQLPDPGCFERALMTMRHRGPDGWGCHRATGVVLGHVRLAILDPAHGAQPWRDETTGVTLVFNGEIYNYQQEARILESRGHFLRTSCDTEVLLRLYLEFGPEMLSRLNGMFAFAIHDPRDGSLLLARDHMGIKPLYVRRTGQEWAFASEVKALVSLADGLEADPRAVADYIALQYVMGEKTFFKGVERLLPGQAMLLRPDGGSRTWRHAQFRPTQGFSGSFEDAANELRGLLESSVALQLRSDVPLGAHLSGGLDTASICSLASRQLNPARLSTFTAGFSEGGVFNDTDMAKLSADAFGTVHREMFPSAQDFASVYPNLVWHLDEPMAGQGVFAQYMVSRLARKHVKVALGGQGADEIFGGYTRHYILLLEQAMRNGAGHGQENLGLGWNELGLGLGQLHNYGPMQALARSGPPFEGPEAMFWRMIDRSGTYRNALTPDFQASLEGYDPYETYLEYMGRHRDSHLLGRVLFFESSCWLPALLHVEDRMSMAVSLESRVPLLDPRIVEFAFSLPAEIAMRGGKTKAIMRAAFQDVLPPEVSARRDKLGFPVPTSRWFSGELKEWLRDVLTSRSALQRGIFTPAALEGAVLAGEGDFGRALWGMLNIELFHGNLRAEGASHQEFQGLRSNPSLTE